MGLILVGIVVVFFAAGWLAVRSMDKAKRLRQPPSDLRRADEAAAQQYDARTATDAVWDAFDQSRPPEG